MGGAQARAACRRCGTPRCGGGGAERRMCNAEQTTTHARVRAAARTRGCTFCGCCRAAVWRINRSAAEDDVAPRGVARRWHEARRDGYL